MQATLLMRRAAKQAATRQLCLPWELVLHLPRSLARGSTPSHLYRLEKWQAYPIELYGRLHRVLVGNEDTVQEGIIYNTQRKARMKI